MAEKVNVGIHGIGIYLPEQVRTNAWWPGHVVAAWRERKSAVNTPVTAESSAPPSDGTRRVLEAMAELQDDPFQGSEERRIMPDAMLASEMERAAAIQAIEQAGIDPREIGLLLCNTAVPDYLITNNACLLHHNLSLHPHCMSLATEAACNAFMIQLSLAEQMIAGGRARFALLVQSCNVSNILPIDQPHSAWFGDGCAAVVVGPVRPEFGILGQAHRTDGSLHRTIVASVRDLRWYEEGEVCLYSADPSGARRSFLEIADSAKDVAGEALQLASCSPEDIKYYAPHQPTRWFRKVTQDYLGLSHASSVDTFRFAASLFGANIPLSLSVGARERLLSAGDLVLMVAGGAGLTYSSMVLRWGR